MRFVVLLTISIFACVESLPTLAQPPRVPPRFEAKCDVGRVEIIEISRVRAFGVKEWIDPYLLLTLRVEKTDDINAGMPVAREATDDTGTSLVSTSSALMALATKAWQEERGRPFTDENGVQWTHRYVALLAPDQKVMTLRSLKLSVPYSKVNTWHEVKLSPTVTGQASMKEEAWAQVSLQAFRMSGPENERNAVATIRQKRIKGQPSVGVGFFQYALRSESGQSLPGRLRDTNWGQEGLDLIVHWAGIANDFQPAEIIFRFPTLDQKETVATFRDIPLP